MTVLWITQEVGAGLGWCWGCQPYPSTVIVQSFFLLAASILGTRMIGKSGNLRLLGGVLAGLAVIITFMFAASVPDVSNIGYNAILIRAIYLAAALVEVGSILRVVRRRQSTEH